MRPVAYCIAGRALALASCSPDVRAECCTLAEALCCPQALLKGISPRSEVTNKNWPALMAERLRRNSFGASLPFNCPRGQEAVTYAALPTSNR